jgi:glucose-1-phosphate adenylyltransferase
VEDSKMKDVLLAEGCRILRSEITHSILGIRSQVADGTVIKDSIIMGADFYERERDQLSIPLGIGANCHIEGAILDKNVRIGDNVVIRPFPRNIDMDNTKWYVRDGVVVIPKDAEIAAGTKIAPQ